MKAEETTDNLKKGKEKREKEEKRENLKWCMEVIIMTFILSITFSYISSTAIKDLSLIPAVFILVFVIFIGIITDIVGISRKSNQESKRSKDFLKIDSPRTKSSQLLLRCNWRYLWCIKWSY